MKSIHVAILGAAVALGGSAMAADTGSLSDFNSRILPVLVQVDAHGKVTDASPSTKLPPRLRRLLLENLGEWITGPAVVHGKPVSSQFVMNLALEVTPRPEGDYYANFAYVSTSPVPPGSWYWVHVDGHRLALANRNGFPGAGPHRFQPQRWPTHVPVRPPLPSIRTEPGSGGMQPAPVAPPPHIH